MAKKIYLSRGRRIFIILCFTLPFFLVLLPLTNINIPFAKSLGIEFLTTYRYAKAPIFYFKKNDQESIFFITEYRRLMSSRSRGGSTYKSYQTKKHLARYNPATNKIEKEAKIDIDIKRVEILGADENVAYLYADGLNVYDPFTLLPIASTKQLEEKNPQLNGQFPNEIQYYKYNNATQKIEFTASNATKWCIGKNLIVTELNFQENTILQDEERAKEAELLEEIKQLGNKRNLITENELKPLNDKLNKAQISSSEHLQLAKTIIEKGKQLDVKIKELNDQWRVLLKKRREKENNIAYQIVKKRGANYFDFDLRNMKIAEILCDNIYYGISDEKNSSSKLKYQYSPLSQTDDVQQKLMILDVKTDEKQMQFLLESTKKVSQLSFINGGFLLYPNSDEYVTSTFKNLYVVISKSAIGDAGKILFTAIDKKGNKQWSFATQSKNIDAYTIQGDTLFIMCNEDKDNEPSHYCDVLYQINLSTGQERKFLFAI